MSEYIELKLNIVRLTKIDILPKRGYNLKEVIGQCWDKLRRYYC